MRNFFFVLLLLLLTGCAAQPSSVAPTEANPATPIVTEAYPPPGESASTAYPMPVAPTPMAEETPTKQAGTGEIKGVLLWNGKPVSDFRIYLANIHATAEGENIAASIDPVSSPYTYTNSAGEFLFVNVQPDTYAFVLNNGVEGYLLYIPGKVEGLLAEVKADTVTDMGTLDYPDLPLQP